MFGSIRVNILELIFNSCLVLFSDKGGFPKFQTTSISVKVPPPSKKNSVPIGHLPIDDNFEDSKFISYNFEDVSYCRKAPAWEYFHLDRAEHLAQCQFPSCAKIISTKNGMTALLIHLRARHNIDLKKNNRKSSSFTTDVLIEKDPSIPF